MIGKTVAVVALAASLAAISISPSLASSKSTSAASESAPWLDTNANAALSRANLTEKVLSPSVVSRIKYLRSVTAPVIPQAGCPGPVVAPVLVHGDLYVITNEQLSKYDAATGALIWRSTPDPTFSDWYSESLAVSDNLVVVGAMGCISVSQPGGRIYAFNATTGARVWQSQALGGATISAAVIASSYVIAAGEDAAGSVVSVFRLSKGTRIWGRYGCGPGSTGPLVVGLLVMWYGCNSQDNETINASNLATGARVWSRSGDWVFHAGDLSGSAGRHLYATDPSGAVVDLNPHTGQTEYTLSGAHRVLAVDGTRVYATCTSLDYICAYNSRTGALEWRNTASMIIGTNIAAEADGVLYTEFGPALNTATGKIISQVWGIFTYSAVTAMAVGDGRIAVVGNPRVLDLYGLKGY
jgi:outer membrane protein assembly factor BamB